jgi:UDP-glucuronate 4-epimerase
MDFIHVIEDSLGKKATLNMLPMQPGDVYETYADTSELKADFGYEPRIGIKTGVQKFVDWYKTYYQK